MTYSAPELLLVGAANNVVLLGSLWENKGLECPDVPADEDISQDIAEYSEWPTW